MDPDLSEVGNRIAAKFAAVDGIRGASMMELDTIPAPPYVVVLSPDLALIERSFSNEMWEWVYGCLLIGGGQADTGRDRRALRDLIPAVMKAWQDTVGQPFGFKLDLEYVQDSFIERATPDDVPSGEASLPAYRIDVRVRIRQNITRVP